jgi:hypothetical protein
MKVELRTQFSGLRDGKHWPNRGEVVDLPDGEAVELLNAGHAVPVPAATPQTAALKK